MFRPRPSRLLLIHNIPKLHEHLAPSVISHPRLLLAGIEYSAIPLEMCLELPVACSQVRILAPKLKAKHPLLVSMLASPNISIALTALQRLQTSTDDSEATFLVLPARSIHGQFIRK